MYGMYILYRRGKQINEFEYRACAPGRRRSIKYLYYDGPGEY
jgi:hypothetical protein